jgi:mRNA m6A methyltransferase catalytic subunit
MPSTREKQNKQVGEEILELLSKQTAKEKSLVEKFKSQGGAQVMEFCPHGTRIECERAIKIDFEDTVTVTETIVKEEIIEKPDDGVAGTAEVKTELFTEDPVAAKKVIAVENNKKCFKLHFKKIIQSHTDPDLGDCSFLNTCFHMDSCK